jgi:hypothetical protein
LVPEVKKASSAKVEMSDANRDPLVLRPQKSTEAHDPARWLTGVERKKIAAEEVRKIWSLYNKVCQPDHK